MGLLHERGRVSRVIATSAVVGTALVALQVGAIQGAGAAPVLPENFDGVTAPNLPSGWVATRVQGMVTDPTWATSTTSPDTSPNDAFVPDPNDITDMTLDSPVFIPAPGSTVSFRNNYNVESTFDGGVLEIKIGAGSFTDIVTAGGSFVTGGYDGTISTGFSSPIAGRMAWTGNSGGYITSTVSLPPAASGQNVQLRWRFASDISVSSIGWRIDTISISPSLPGLATQASFGGPIGTAVSDTATVTPSNATGSVTFKLFDNAACSGSPVFQSRKLVGGGGATTSGSFAPSNAGTYYWTADYSGDGSHSPSSSTCGDTNESVTILPAFTRTVSGPSGPITVGASEVVNVANAQVSGGLTVNAGGKVVVTGSFFNGPIMATSPGFLSLCGAQVNAAPSLTVTNSQVPIRVGDNSPGCTGNTFFGDVTLTANAGVTFGVNTVNGNAVIDSNGPASTTVKSNRVARTLECSGNNPPPSNAGQPNAAASKLGQCASL